MAAIHISMPNAWILHALERRDSWDVRSIPTFVRFVFILCVCAGYLFMCPQRLDGVVDPLELKLQMVVSCHVDAEN